MARFNGASSREGRGEDGGWVERGEQGGHNARVVELSFDALDLQGNILVLREDDGREDGGKEER